MDTNEVVVEYCSNAWNKKVVFENPNDYGQYLLTAFESICDFLETFYSSKAASSKGWDLSYILDFDHVDGSAPKELTLFLSLEAELIINDILYKIREYIITYKSFSPKIIVIQSKLFLSSYIPIHIKFVLYVCFKKGLYNVTPLRANGNESIITDYIFNSYQIVKSFPDNKDIISAHLLKAQNFNKINANEIEKYFEYYERMELGQLIENYLCRNLFEECITFLLKELDVSTELNADKILDALIVTNNLFTIVDKQVIHDSYINNSHKIKQKELFEIMLWLYPIKPESTCRESNYLPQKTYSFVLPDLAKESMGIMHNFTGLTKQAGYIDGTSFADIDTTVFQFTLPFPVNVSELYSQIDGIKFQFTRIEHFSKHPFYFMYDRTLVGGNTIGHLFDIDIDSKESTFVQAILQERYHPEFTFTGVEAENDRATNNVDLSDEQALHGMEYIPSKIRIIKALREVAKDNKEVFPIDLSFINASAFSCLRILYQNRATTSILMERMYLFTSSKVYSKFTEKYTEKLSKLGVYDVDFIENFKAISINNYLNFQNFLIFLFNKVIINQIHDKSGYKNFWRDIACVEPKSEPEVQPYLRNLIEPLCAIKGVHVSREVVSSEGEVDLFFSYTTPQGRPLKICAEIKNAHHAHVTTAIGTQLTRYLDAEQTKYGLYIVLWFKYPKDKKKTRFSDPIKYSSVEELRLAIQANYPSAYKIDTIIVDCTKSKSPSIK